jgi:hypothetical protein
MTLLDRRIKEYNIPDWPGQALYGRIIVYRIKDENADRKTFTAGGVIEMPDDVASTQKWKAPRGIIVSAGLLAMDILRGNGIGLGEVIWMASHSPWRFEVDSKLKDGKVESVDFYFMQAGDAVLSEDLVERIREGDAVVEFENGKHRYVVEGKAFPRFDPPEHPDDM